MSSWNRAGIACAAGALLMLTGCAGGDDPAEPPADPAQSSEDVADATEATDAPTTKTTSEAAGVGSPVSCAPADGPSLTDVTLTDAGDELEIQWETDGTTGSQTTQWSVSISDADYTSAYQIGVKQIGATADVFVFDFITAEQANLASDTATVSGTSVNVAVPWSELGDMTGDLSWNAVLSADGEDVATCPVPGEDLLNPVQQTLTRG